MIYFAQDVATCHVKIGFHGGNDVSNRLRTLQTGCPSELFLLATIPGTMQDEHELHKRFAAARVAGEWFRPVPELLALIMDSHDRREVVHVTPPYDVGDPRRLFDPDDDACFDGSGQVLILHCPFCGYEYTHTEAAFTRVGDDIWEAGVYDGTEARGITDWRRSALVLVFNCEQGHRWELVIQQHKGNNLVCTNRLADTDPFDGSEENLLSSMDEVLALRAQAKNRLLNQSLARMAARDAQQQES